MQTTENYLAIDLGASSGRAILGRLSEDGLHIEEIHRFANLPLQINDSLHWNLPDLFKELVAGITHAGKICPDLKSIGIDSWGVDYGLLSETGELIELPYAYRDRRTEGVMDRVFATLSREEIYTATGIQFMPFNTLFQLCAATTAQDELLKRAHRMLFVPDLLNYWLTGEQQSEYTIASTSQMISPTTGKWAYTITEPLDIPSTILPPIVNPGTIIGPLKNAIAQQTGLSSTSVIAPACHDTASAVAAVPAEGDNWAYISSGTWSLIGVELNAPNITPYSLAANFTNEGGVANTIRFLKNVAGLWLVQECRRTWMNEYGPVSHQVLVAEAAHAAPFARFIDPEDSRFVEPGDMPARLNAYLSDTGQPLPANRADLIRCILESLAMRYRDNLTTIEKLTSRTIETVHIVGGGVQNELLCQFTANATGRRVVAGPVEATAIGNIIVQAMACNRIPTLADARRIIARSTELKQYLPTKQDDWSNAFARFQQLTSSTTP